MNPQTHYDLHEQKRLELLQQTEKMHHHNRLLNHRPPEPMKMIAYLKSSIRTIPKLRHLRIRVQFEVVEPCPEGANG